jgi:hypothetical protein
MTQSIKAGGMHGTWIMASILIKRAIQKLAERWNPAGFEYTHDHHDSVWRGFEQGSCVAADAASWLTGVDGREPFAHRG